MKKLLLILSTLLVLLPFSAHADLWGGIFGPGWGTLTDTKYCTYDSATNTVICNSAGGSGAVSTDSIWAAAGDLVYGTGNDTASILSKGTAYQLLMMNSGATAPAWTSTLGATGTRLTGGFFTDLTVTNAIAGSTTGNILNSLADAKGDLAVASANDTWGRMAHPGAANYVLTTNATDTYAWAATHTHSDSAAQFYSATASKGTLKFDQTGISDTKTVTVKYTAADSYTYTPTFTGNTGVTFPTSGTLAVTSGALGTPSFTALNIPSGTGDAGTTAGQVVHDNNDTAGSANGNLEWYDGTNVRSIVDTGTTYTVITKTEFLPIAWAVNGATAPSAIAAVTGKEINARSFTEGDDVVFWWVVPNDYVGGIKYRVHYALSANASADETVIYSMAGSIVANSGDLDGSAGTALTITDELGTDDDQYQYMVTDYSAESNSDWSLAAGGLARLNFSNAAAGDLASGEPLVIGIEIKYKAKIIGFAGY